jgi:hypothetical protein
MKLLCDTMKRQIVSRAFYGWLAHCRHLKTIRLHLVDLVHVKNDNEDVEDDEDIQIENEFKEISCLTNELWLQWLKDEKENGVPLKHYEKFLYEFIYQNGINNNELRAKIWPFLLKHYKFEMNAEERFEKDVETKTNYSNLILEWKIFEDFIRQRERQNRISIFERQQSSLFTSSEVVPPPTPIQVSNNRRTSTCIIQNVQINKEKTASFDKELNLTPIVTSINTTTPKIIQHKNLKNVRNDLILLRKDSSLSNEVFIEEFYNTPQATIEKEEPCIPEESSIIQSQSKTNLNNDINDTNNSRHSSSCSFLSFNDEELDNSINEPAIEENISPIVNKNVFKSLDNKELVDNFATNINRIDKDVTRCDRNYYYFTTEDNLQKLRNIMYT